MPEQADFLGGGGRKMGVGHAGLPGTGPDGETCGSCKWARRQPGTQNTYYKCGHERGSVTSGAATDIRLKDAACEYWLAEDE